MTTLETTIDRDIYLIMQSVQPALVAAVTDLVRAGQTPAAIEAAMVAKCGVSQTTRNARHIAEYLARTLR